MTLTTKTVPTIDATVSRTSDGQANGLILSFSNGQSLTLSAASLTHDIIAEALVHGLKQKLVDAAAIARNPDTGRSATVADKFDAVREVYDRLLLGQWNKVRDGNGATGGLLLRALMQHTGKDRADIAIFLASKTDEQRAALRRNPKIAAIIVTLKPEPKADTSIDTDAMLGELDA